MLKITIGGDSKTFGRGMAFVRSGSRQGRFDRTDKVWTVEGDAPVITVDGREIVFGDADYGEYFRRLYGGAIVVHDPQR